MAFKSQFEDCQDAIDEAKRVEALGQRITELERALDDLVTHVYLMQRSAHSASSKALDNARAALANASIYNKDRPWQPSIL